MRNERSCNLMLAFKNDRDNKFILYVLVVQSNADRLGFPYHEKRFAWKCRDLFALVSIDDVTMEDRIVQSEFWVTWVNLKGLKKEETKKTEPRKHGKFKDQDFDFIKLIWEPYKHPHFFLSTVQNTLIRRWGATNEPNILDPESSPIACQEIMILVQNKSTLI